MENRLYNFQECGIRPQRVHSIQNEHEQKEDTSGLLLSMTDLSYIGSNYISVVLKMSHVRHQNKLFY